MASECCLSLTKYFLFLFNLIFYLLGSFLLCMGLWTLFSETKTFWPPISHFSYLLIISGSLTMSLGFFGCLGSLKTVKCLLATYFILLTVLLAAQIVGGVLFYTQKNQLTGQLKQHTLGLMASLGENVSSSKSFEETLNYIQQKVRCCGWDGKEDWGESIPCSCYNKVEATVNATVNATLKYEIKVIALNDSQNCLKCFRNDTCGIYNQGCNEKIMTWLEGNLFQIWVVILAIPVVEICGMILSMCLYKEGHVDYNRVLS